MLLDALGAFEDMPSWDDAADNLFNAGLTLNPSALHGAMAGLLGAGFSPHTEQHFTATVAALEKALAIDLTGDLVDFVSRLSLATLSAIQDADYTFQPLMPEDDGSLEERLLSIAEWSRGFLSGFTQGITLREAAGEPIPTMTAEALKDMAAIAQVETEEATSSTRRNLYRKATVKISKAEFTRRRKKLMAMMDRHSIAIIPGAREVTRSRDTEYPFRQNSDLFYLTGFEEPDAVLVLVPGRRQGQVVLFCRERDPEMELWNGYRLGPECAAAYLGVDDAFPIDDLDEILPGLIAKSSLV